jgi:hypothetical protein
LVREKGQEAWRVNKIKFPDKGLKGQVFTHKKGFVRKEGF